MTQNPFTTESPPGPLLPIGRVIRAPLGPRRLIYAGDRIYIHRHHRRYFCIVRSWVDEPHTTYTGRRCTRRIVHAQIIEYA